jgi:hypothetical protein
MTTCPCCQQQARLTGTSSYQVPGSPGYIFEHYLCGCGARFDLQYPEVPIKRVVKLLIAARTLDRL